MATAPDQTVDAELLERLEAWSDRGLARKTGWTVAPSDNVWYVANMTLCVLGPDLARDVRAITGPVIQSARLEEQESHRAGTEMIRDAIRDGTAERVHFMVHLQEQSIGDRHRVRSRAVERIHERRTGSACPATTAFELAAEIASHPLDRSQAPSHDPRTADAVQRFQKMCGSAPINPCQ